MSSDKKKNCVQKMFDVDPAAEKSSRPPLLPLDIKSIREIFRPSPKCVSQGPRPFPKLEPLNFKDFEDTEERPTKLRKIDLTQTSVRKGLFSTKDTQKSRVSVNRTRAVTRKVQPKNSNPKSSPLLNLEEVEEKLINERTVLKGSHFKSPTPCRSFAKLTNSKSKTKPLQVPNLIVEECEDDSVGNLKISRPMTPDSTDEFSQLEAILEKESKSNSNLNSPITSICHLMQDSVINSVRRTKLNFGVNSDVTNSINDVEKMIEDENVRHEQNISRLNGILKTLKRLSTTEVDNKENKTNRRSVRLLNKSPLRETSKLLTSPAISKSGDLRKSTLKKNLAAKSGTQSPRTRKAMDLYNSMRSQNSVLETPKADRKMMGESPLSLGSKLSLKVQDQCLLLQDTPLHR